MEEKTNIVLPTNKQAENSIHLEHLFPNIETSAY